jgi:outer membrane protein
MNLKTIVFSLLLLFSFASVQAQQKHELTVQEAVDLAFKNVVEIKNAQLDYQIQEAKNKEIFGMALPQVAGNAGVNHYLQLPKILFPDGSRSTIYDVLIKEQLLPGGTTVPSPVIQQVSFQQPWNSSIGATITQLLFQPDVFVGLQARKTALDLSASNVEQVKERIRDSAYKKYYAILIAEKQSYFLKQGIQRLEKLYHDDSIMFKNGFAERLDLDKIEVQLTNLRTTASIIDNAIQLSYGALKFTLGIPQKDVVVLKEDLSVEKLKENILDEGFNYEDRIELKTLGFAKKLQELDAKRYKLAYFPTIAAQGSYSVNGQGQDFITSKNTTWIKSSFVGVSLSLPIFDGFQRKYKLKQSQLNIQKVDNTIDNVKQAIDFEQFATRESLKNSLLNLDAQQRNMALAEKVYNTTKIKFENGLGSSFEVLQADNDFQQAQANYFSALYNAIVGKISYQKSLGKLK